MQLMIYNECGLGLTLKENEQFPNRGSLRHLSIIKRNKKPISNDYWTNYSLKGDLFSDGVSRYKWIWHHITPRRSFFIPMKHNMGPNPDLVNNLRTNHIQYSEQSNILYLDDCWNDSVMSHSKLERSVNQRTTCIHAHHRQISFHIILATHHSICSHNLSSYF